MKLRVRVIPNAARDAFSNRREAEWLLRLRAPAIEGKANRAALDFIAEHLEIPRSCVALVSGEKSRHKIFEIVGLDPSDVERKLSQSR